MPQLSVVENKPQIPQGQEPTKDTAGQPDQYEQLLAKHGPKLVALIAQIKAKWEWKRRGIVSKVLKNKEMLKGNHSIGFYPGTFDTFDAMDEYYNFTGTSDARKNGDQSMDRRPHNFYQMLEKAFVSALSAQIPKTRWMPVNADDEADRATSKAASQIEEIIERANKAKSMVKQELMELFTSGCYFKHTRYVVDADRTGTHKETTTQVMESEVIPARYMCFRCGSMTPEDTVATQKSLTCPNCSSPLGPENYFEQYVSQIPVASEQSDVPNGMVLQTVYGPIHIDADPDAPDLLNTCLLDLREEVSLGWLRTTFPKLWMKFEEGQSSGETGELIERQYRDMLTTPAGYSTWSSFATQGKPTYARTWLQPMAFAELASKADADELQQAFPKGCMLASVGAIPLQIRPCKLTDEWTHCSSEQRGFGLFTNPLGDPAVPVQERINDCINKIDEYMDRLACGILLANEQHVDTRAMNGKIMLPGLLNPVMFKKGTPPSAIQDAIFQVRGEIDAMIFQYVATLKQDMELLVGTPPQTFGAGTQEGVDTMGGQKQQLDTGMMKMGLTWDSLRDEHAEAAENAVKCAGANMTEDWQSVVTDENKEYRNVYVHLDQVKGSVHAEPEADQGFPMTYAEIRSFYEQMFTQPDSQLVQMLMSEPKNIDNALRYIAIPGLVAPGGGMRTKILRIIDQLVKSQPIQQVDPMSGQPIEIPSVQPNKYLDDLGASQKLIEGWSQEHWDKLENNPAGLANLVAYYKMCVVFEKEKAAEMAIPVPGQPGQPGQPQQQPAMA